MTQQHLVGIAQMYVSRDKTDVIVAPNLGSCLGIAAYDSSVRCGGIVHCLLPLSKSDPVKAADTPCMYVDTGFAHMLDVLLTMGAKRDTLRIVAVGGANINDEGNVFEIGKKNYTVLKKMLWKNSLALAAENIGDNVSRTLTLNMDGGVTHLKIRGESFEI